MSENIYAVRTNQLRSRMQQESDRLLLELIARYIAIVIFNAVVKLAMKYRDIETAQDEARRASWEDSLLHVQNMVLDNCLSTVKHETIYYPNRIKQLIGKLRSGKLSETEEWETVAAISELIEYYKGVFYILSQCASRQLEEVTFRRTVIPVPVICHTGFDNRFFTSIFLIRLSLHCKPCAWAFYLVRTVQSYFRVRVVRMWIA